MKNLPRLGIYQFWNILIWLKDYLISFSEKEKKIKLTRAKHVLLKHN